MTFYHYTCDHGREQIGDSGVLLPAAALTEGAVLWTAILLWLTDMATPDRDALGLTSRILRCDRTTHRYRVTDESNVMPWWQIARGLPREYRDYLEGEPGARPMHWFVSTEGVPAVYDPIRVAVDA